MFFCFTSSLSLCFSHAVLSLLFSFYLLIVETHTLFYIHILILTLFASWRPSLLRLSKQLWSTITQLKLEVGYFKYYLNRLPDYFSANCPFCQVSETPEHLLLNCSE